MPDLSAALQNFSLEDLVIFLFCEIIGVPFAYAAAQEILDGKYASGIVGFAIGVSFGVVGFSWHWIKPWATKLMLAIGRTISPAYFLSALLVLFVYVAGPNFAARIEEALYKHRAATQIERSGPELEAKSSETPSPESANSARSADTEPTCVQVVRDPKGDEDLRLAPFVPGSDFFSEFPMTDESVIVWCFPYDPPSCNIALKYRDGLAKSYDV